MELFEYWDVFLRRKKLVLTILFCVMICVSIYLCVVNPVYEATSKLLITNDRISNLLGGLAAVAPDMVAGFDVGHSDPIATQMEVLKTLPIIEEVIRRSNLTLTPEEILKKTKIDNLRNTNIITLSYHSTIPAKAMEVVNKWLEVMIERNLHDNQEEFTTAKLFIESQLINQKRKIKDAAVNTLDTKKREDVVALDQETQQQVNVLSGLATRKMDIDSQLRGAYAQQSEIKNKMTQKDALVNSFYPQWMNIHEEKNNEITNLLAQKTQIERELNNINNKFRSIPQKEAILARALGDERIANEIYTKLLAKYEEVKISEASQMGNLRIIEKSNIPIKPVYPNKILFFVLSVVGGFLLGLSVALLKEYFSDSPQSFEKVREIVPYPIVGTIPFSNKSKTFIVKERPYSLGAESYRLIQISLSYCNQLKKQTPILLVTSAIAGEGKTTSAINLASVYSEGMKVLLIELDFRRPQFQNIFGCDNDKKGLIQFLNKDTLTLDDIVIDTDKGFSIITAGEVLNNPNFIFKSKKLWEAINNLKSRFDIIILDTPPITLVAETLGLMSRVDGVVFVIDMFTSSSNLKQMNRLLEHKDLPILGIIMNKLKNQRGYGTNKYGGYYNS